MATCILNALLAALLPAHVAGACTLGATVRYFNGFVTPTWHLVGTPVPFARVLCQWDGAPGDTTYTPTSCPIYMRTDNGGLDTSNMQFDTVSFTNVGCGGPGQAIVGVTNYCWYTSQVTMGPSINDEYSTTDGSSGIPYYMIYSGSQGENGVCGQADPTCTTVAYECEDYHTIRPGQTLGIGGCQNNFCDPSIFSQGCCRPLCAWRYGYQAGTCPTGYFGGAYDQYCQAYTCDVITDGSICCKETETCYENSLVEYFDGPTTTSFENVGFPITGRVHCYWPDAARPPMTCEFYQRTDGGTFDQSSMTFATVSSGTVNCARENGIGTRYCWKMSAITMGPDIYDQYTVADGTSGLAWYMVFKYIPGTSMSACNQGNPSCGSVEFTCPYGLAPGQQAGLAGCQQNFCDLDTFEYSCCATTTTTTVTTITDTTITSTTTTSTTTHTTTTITVTTVTETTTTTTTNNITSTTTTNTTVTITTSTQMSTTTLTSTTSTVTTTTEPVFFGGSDPVTYSGDEWRGFWLPPGELTHVLSTGQMNMYAQAFLGSEYEQWFDRIVVTGSDGWRLAEISIKKDIGASNKTQKKNRKLAFETIDVTIGMAKKPLEVMPRPDGFFRNHMGVHIGVSKMGQIFKYGPYLGPQMTINGARREVVQIRCKSADLLVISSPAREYYGDLAHLAVKYAHLDIIVLEMKNRADVRGVLPELWGVKPLSNKTRAVMDSPPIVENASGHAVCDTCRVETPAPTSEQMPANTARSNENESGFAICDAECKANMPL